MTLYFSISEITLDTAIDQQRNTEVAYPVEQCRCPPGYTGLSCEVCTENGMSMSFVRK